MLRHRFAPLGGAGTVALCALLAACGGGSGATNPSTPATATPSPIPTAASTQVPVSGAATSAPIPAAGGYAGSISLPASTASNATVTITTSLTPPSGVTALLRPQTAVPPTAIPLFYETFTTSVADTFNGLPGFTITMPATAPTDASYYVGVVDPTSKAWVQATGPATITSGSLTFASVATPFTLNANTAYAFGFYAVPNSMPTSSPTTSPTASPTSSPTATPTSSPSSSPTGSALSACAYATNGGNGADTKVCGASGTVFPFNGTGDQTLEEFTLSGGTPPYSVKSNDPSMTSVVWNDVNNAWFVTALQAGTTSVVFADSAGNTLTANLQITVTTGVIQGHAH